MVDVEHLHLLDRALRRRQHHRGRGGGGRLGAVLHHLDDGAVHAPQATPLALQAGIEQLARHAYASECTQADIVSESSDIRANANCARRL
jgi:hypothetical protein